MHIVRWIAKERPKATERVHIFMRLAAIICATAPSAEPGLVPRGQLAFAGQSLLEYQARQARDAGAERVLILVEAVAPSLSRAVDNLHADGVTVQLIRDMASLMRDAPRDCDMLLFADGAISQQPHVDALAASAGNAVLVAEDAAASAHFERIDGMHRWVGLARITPDVLFGTLDLIGDWDVPSTLLRAALQVGAKRIAVPAQDVVEGRVALVDRQETADLVALALLAPVGKQKDEEAGVEHYLLRPLADLFAARLVRMQSSSLRLRFVGGGVALVGMLALYPGWKPLALVFFLAALTINLVADRLAAMARRSYGDGWAALAPVGLVLLGIVMLEWADAAYAALAAGLVHLAIRWRRGADLPRWACWTPGSLAVLLLVGSLLGTSAGALAIGTLAGIGSLGALLLRDGRIS